MSYLLPSHPDLKVDDRLDVTGSSEPEVPLWDFLLALDLPAVDGPGALVSKLETIEVTIRGRQRNDFAGLRNFLDANWPSGSDVWTSLWPNIAELALKLPVLFPSHELPILSAEKHPRLSLTREQTASLVVHQFLCTVSKPSWRVAATGPYVNDWCEADFHAWYLGRPPMPPSVDAYMQALFAYLARIGKKDEMIFGEKAWTIELGLHSMTSDKATALLEGSDGQATHVEILRPAEYSVSPELQGMPSGAVCVFANRHIGFGASGTQEEVYAGSAPESCVAVLVTPTLRDNEVLAVRGTEPMITMVGYGHTARLGTVLKNPGPNASPYAGRTMLFMDALELDMVRVAPGRLADLMPENLQRELVKALVAFSSSDCLSQPKYQEISTGLWGCGAFGGNPHIKLLIQWIACSCLGLPCVKFVLAGREGDDLADELNKFVAYVRDKPKSYLKFLTLLRRLADDDSALWNAQTQTLEDVLAMLDD